MGAERRKRYESKNRNDKCRYKYRCGVCICNLYAFGERLGILFQFHAVCSLVLCRDLRLAYFSKDEKKLAGMTAAGFAVMYATLISLVYFTQVTTVQAGSLSGVRGLSPWFPAIRLVFQLRYVRICFHVVGRTVCRTDIGWNVNRLQVAKRPPNSTRNLLCELFHSANAWPVYRRSGQERTGSASRY